MKHDELSVNTTMVFIALLSLLETGKIRRLKFDETIYTADSPHFTFEKELEEYVVEVTLSTSHSIYTKDEYLGLGRPLFTGYVCDLTHYIAKKL